MINTLRWKELCLGYSYPVRYCSSCGFIHWSKRISYMLGESNVARQENKFAWHLPSTELNSGDRQYASEDSFKRQCTLYTRKCLLKHCVRNLWSSEKTWRNVNLAASIHYHNFTHELVFLQLHTFLLKYMFYLKEQAHVVLKYIMIIMFHSFICTTRELTYKGRMGKCYQHWIIAWYKVKRICLKKVSSLPVQRIFLGECTTGCHLCFAKKVT